MLHMEPSLEQRIRERAYEIWNATGREDGRADEHWLSAERELIATPRVQPAAAKMDGGPKITTSHKPNLMVLVGFIFALALGAVSPIPQHLWLSDSWRQPTGDRTMEMTASEPLTSATPAIENDPTGAKGITVESRVEPEITNSTCFASASAVRQDHPDAWPSWTLRALGHEGAKCWYPTTRTLAHDHPK
jgi:hypothetical protein